jgi:Ca-activated chloride channel family protein
MQDEAAEPALKPPASDVFAKKELAEVQARSTEKTLGKAAVDSGAKGAKDLPASRDALEARMADKVPPAQEPAAAVAKPLKKQKSSKLRYENKKADSGTYQQEQFALRQNFDDRKSNRPTEITEAELSGARQRKTDPNPPTETSQSSSITMDMLSGGERAKNRKASRQKGTMRIGGNEYIIEGDGSLIAQPSEKAKAPARRLQGRAGRGVASAPFGVGSAGGALDGAGIGYDADSLQAFGNLEAEEVAPPHASARESRDTYLQDGVKTEASKPGSGISFEEHNLHTTDFKRIAPPMDTSVADIERERYDTWQENPRIQVSAEAKSTFSIDVDTASYTNARRFLRTGHLPPANSVRTEEFINYFKYDYPQVKDSPFGVVYEIAPSPLEKDRHLLRLGVNSRSVGEATKPWNLVFLVDVSGSMATNDKLGLVKQSLKLLVGQMKNSDRISIVTYAGSSRIALHPTGIENKQAIIQAIDALNAAGSTHGSSGIQMAYQLAERSRIAGGVNRVILATDGDFNVGVTSNEQLINVIEQKRRSGTTLTAVGVGTGNLNESMMEQLANKGNGNYFYLDSFNEARRVFSSELTSTIENVAKDVKLQVEFNPEHVYAYRLIGYENRRLRNQDFHNDAVDAGEIGAGHTVTALYELVLTGTELAKRIDNDYRYQKPTAKKVEQATNEEHSAEIAFLQVRYKDPEGTQSKLLQFPILKSQIKELSGQTTEDFRFVSAVSYFAHVLRKSQFKGSYSLRDIEALASGAMSKDHEGQRREFVELVRSAAAVSGE